MKCLNERVCTMFLDNELEPGERKRAAAHLEQCPKCRERVKYMEEENHALATAFNEEDTPDLVSLVMDKLRAPESLQYSERKPKRRHTLHWAMAAAASVVVAGFLWFFLWFENPSPGPGETEMETRVIICNARVEGQDVQSHIFDSTAPDITFIWFEKQ